MPSTSIWNDLLGTATSQKQTGEAERSAANDVLSWLITTIGGGINRTLTTGTPAKQRTIATVTPEGAPVATQKTKSTLLPKKALTAQTTKKDITKKQASKAATKSTAQWQKDYSNYVLSLLEPYQYAVGDLPEEFLNYVTQLKQSPESNVPSADEMALQLAQQYSPTITASPSTQPAGLTSAETTALTVVNKQNSAGGPLQQALSQLAQNTAGYEQAAPYSDILKALLGRVQENTMYGLTGTQIPEASNWPQYLKDLYSTVIGGTTTTGALSVPGLGTVSSASKKNKKTSKQTSNVPSGSTGGLT